MAQTTKFTSLVQVLTRPTGWYWGISKMFRECVIKFGALVGEDKYGNKYYENKNYFVARHRWVDYKDWWKYDASDIPAEWHRWIHFMTDDPPTIDPPVERKFLSGHKSNMTGSYREYVPYSTTRRKIDSWSPPQKE
ncbi:NADH dehydrogenase [ubiquinone] 1 alpha subcomplex subunit 12 [Trichoplax sp. H2]|uniref:NADH dehydrogenase [ubiquinone] 1 alpha subcomplex subunit 12 n=1 Tax=Trichoplax adhaerens TaxID=10228 RepID=B3RWZ8_TRIAD|nr:hypothetical protein TRIADDRAFT_56942 [Trichoplax adhaerens]EDV25222.1 hypothetical protein TRIADDRAFT_56942 [Trichoplax adhaerens]RDD43564.1 NADH dehydrogenase [ubiquinone] 1 alpha subcomplex subunit 12 [Trichoplax sp. H2]|eukprot:XP_002113112.1 hypothetical protein TRIADDRAFT_56942 [Trichoplax adhaerens]